MTDAERKRMESLEKTVEELRGEIYDLKQEQHQTAIIINKLQGIEDDGTENF